jgi:rfaE bifunctional protein kinase chain/domain
MAASSRKLLVVGDVMLDEFVWGRVSRISPEAPVPVVEVEKETSYPGGAANVARNLRPFCAGVHLCGLVGEDVHAGRLRELLAEELISTDALVAEAGRSTIVKTRIVARQQQVVRPDRQTINRIGHLHPCLAAGLAYYIAIKKAPDRIQMLKAIYEEEFERAATEDRDRASLRLTPSRSNYRLG